LIGLENLNMKRLFVALVAASLPLTAAVPALAHTAVRETSIADNATLSSPPANFTVTFSAASGLANVRLTNAAGREVALDYRPPRTLATAFTIPLPTLPPGAYTISWRIMSGDGHVMPGAVRFRVAG
jgi:methionine-rich copper-binding protein CopC